MDAQEFVRWMPPSALVDTIADVWAAYTAADAQIYVLRVCWLALSNNVGDEAFAMVSNAIDGLMYDFVEVVS